MTMRSVEDRLREEYFHLLPEIRRVKEYLETEVRHYTLPISIKLDKYEQLVVTSRIKECESALDALRRRQEGATFDRGRPEIYTLTDLNDLAGIRILAFPTARVIEIKEELQKQFPSWVSDPVPHFDANTNPLAFKYHGLCKVSGKIRGEFQIVPMLTGLFWQVEHSAIYKPSPSLKGIARSLEMQECTREVLNALRNFESEFENLIRNNS